MVLLSESPTALEQGKMMAVTECTTSASVVNDAVDTLVPKSPTHWLVPEPFVTLSQISWLILIPASTFLTLNAACSLSTSLGDKLCFQTLVLPVVPLWP